MNIAIDIRCLMNKHRTGVGEYTYELLSSLFSIDKENQYFLFYNSYKDVSGVVPKWEQDNVRYVVTRWSNKLLNFLILFGIVKLDCLIEKRLSDLNRSALGGKDCKIKRLEDCCNNLITKQSNNLDWFFAPNINFISLSKKVKFILTIHDLSFGFLPECYSWKRRLWHKIINPRKLCQRADIVLTVSENTRRDVLEKFKVKSHKSKVLYPGISNKFKADSSKPTGEIKKKYNLAEKYILYLGTIEPRKNIDAIIEAFKLSELLFIGYELIIAGTKGWECEETMNKIEKTKGVRYIGYVDAQDKMALYKLASAFVFPSLYEGFGLPVLEAMSVGTPVVTSNRSSLPEVVGESAYLVNPYNISEIFEGMKYCVKQEKRDNVRIDFNWEDGANNFLKTCNSNL